MTSSTSTRVLPTTHAPFLDAFAAIHEAMRRDARRLPIAIERARTTADAAAIGRWYASFHAAIDHHHRREDDLVWPELVRRDPSFDEHVAGLAEDHHALDAALGGVGAELAALATGRSDRRGAAVSAADTLCMILHDHLHREEAAAFDRLGRAYTADEYSELERRMTKGMTLADLAFVVPWMIDGLDAKMAKEKLADLPAPVRFLIRTVCTRRHHRIAAPILAVAS